MPRKKAKDEMTEETGKKAEAVEPPACGSGASCAETCGPRVVPVEDALVGMVRLLKDGVGSLAGLGNTVAPGLKKGMADLTSAASQGLKRVVDLAGSGGKKPAA